MLPSSQLILTLCASSDLGGPQFQGGPPRRCGEEWIRHSSRPPPSLLPPRPTSITAQRPHLHSARHQGRHHIAQLLRRIVLRRQGCTACSALLKFGEIRPSVDMLFKLPWLLALVLPAFLIALSHAFLLDSGADKDDEPRRSQPESPKHDANRHPATRVVGTTAPTASPVDSLTSYSSIERGCRRTTDFFQQVCSNPLADPASGEGATSPKVSADLLVCSVPEVEPLVRSDSDVHSVGKAPSATYAVSGTIVIRGSAIDADSASGLPELGDAASSSAPPNDRTADNPERPPQQYPGPEDEGFWRQRDGRHEWQPASNAQPGQKVELNIADASESATHTNTTANQPAADGRGAFNLSEYDAWSAAQDQATFLSFQEWKQRLEQDSADRNSPQRGEAAEAKSVREQPVRPSNGPSATPRQAGTRSDSDHTVSSNGDGGGPTRISDTSVTPSEPGARQQSIRTNPDHASTAAEKAETPGPDVQGADDPARSISDKVEPARVGLSVAASGTSAQLAKLKHRWNFASLDCAAVVHRTNPEAKFASSILSEKKDRYMLSPCPHRSSRSKGSTQFVIVELCEEIKIDTLVLANYEFFSNMFKKFTVTAARQLTGRASDWVQLGVFRARNVRGQQVFRIQSAPRSEDFFRYVRIDFLEHFGSEYYCPVSLLRVYGITEMEEWKRGYEEQPSEIDPVAGAGVDEQPFVDDALPATLTPEDALPRDPPPVVDAVNLTAKDEDVWRKHEQAFQRKMQNQSFSHLAGETEMLDTSTQQRDAQPSPALPQQTSLESPSESVSVRTPDLGGASDDYIQGQCAIEEDPAFKSELMDRCPRPRGHAKPFYNLISASSRQRDAMATHRDSLAKMDGSSATAPAKLPSGATSADVEGEQERARRASFSRAGGPGGAPQSGSESVYRAIHRRLNALEANATLSHSYIEHSGQMLREVFARMEKRQELRMSDMLRALNSSNWQQIESLKRRQHVDLQRAIFEFDVHRQQADSERRALLREVQILAEEVLLEKRLSIAQLVMLLIVFVLVGLTRGSRAAPLLHSGLAKIGRTSRRREGKSELQVAVPVSPKKMTPRSERKSDARLLQPYATPLVDKADPERSPARLASGSGRSLTARRSQQELNSTSAVDHAPVLSTPGPPRGSVARMALPASGANPVTKAANTVYRSRSQGESMIGMLSHPRTKRRLILLLHTLDALDLEADRRRSRIAPPRSMPRHSQANENKGPPNGQRRQMQRASIKSPGDNAHRALRAQKLITAHHRDTDHRQVRDHTTPTRDRKPEAPVFDDLAGMSSDWTERSENEEASENAACLSDEDWSHGQVPREHVLDVPTLMHGELRLGHPPIEAKRSLPALTTNGFPLPLPGAQPHSDQKDVASSRGPSAIAAQPKGRAFGAGEEPPKPAWADGRVSSSDSESEGGAWHRVLPRRTGNGSSLRRARQGTIDGKTSTSGSNAKPGGRTEAFERRASPRPSSAQGNNHKPHRPGLSRLFGTRTPDVVAPHSPNDRRSGTPDTIRSFNAV
ncbi:sad1/UNC domain protein [Moesziomyces antarcticus]|uniref:Sad1/UNC domain protein n=2 Tax=Pseudozyma antarctica TaxID=84753 RepID=A0A081CHZ8_PSEA2|nr:sad1/UNC domain protein [Moesziomyces antarcticus]GAK66294.1 sad1/UNC domain protein [Moesziomyces antarcticus]